MFAVHDVLLESLTISAVPVMASSGIEYIWCLVSTFQLFSSSAPTLTSMTRKLVPPRSRARKSPTSVRKNKPHINRSPVKCVFPCQITINVPWCAYPIPVGWSRRKWAAFWRWPCHESLIATLCPFRTASSSSPLWALLCSSETLTGSALPAPWQNWIEQKKMNMTVTKQHSDISEWLHLEASCWDLAAETACGDDHARILKWRSHHEDLIHHRAVARSHLHHLVQMRADTRHLQSFELSASVNGF